MPGDNPFPTSNLSNLWTVLVRSLRNDPVLQSAVGSWCVFDGSDDDLAEPSGDQMPHVRLEPVAGSGAWLDNNSHQYNLPIKVTIGVAGTDVTALFDAWEALRVALFTGNTLLNRLNPYGLIQKTLTVPATGVQTFGEATGLVGVGTLLLKIRVDS
jgi:hypothetical protein